MKISGPVKYHMRKQDSTLVFPRVIIFDAPDGTGKTTMLGYLKRQLIKDGLHITHNEFSYNRRKDEDMLQFRINVAKTRNKRILNYNVTDDIIIIDKCPYVEYPYQRTNWERNDRLNKQEEKCLFNEVFKLKHVIDNATVILLKNKEAWNNYSAREAILDGKTNFPTMAKHTYEEMEANFEKCATEVYNSYNTLEIKNDDKSWKNIYNLPQMSRFLTPINLKWTNVEEEIPSIKEEKDKNLI
jgi:thymidylate kinase